MKRGWAIFFRVNRDLIFFFSSDSPFTMINLCKNVALASFNIGGLFFVLFFPIGKVSLLRNAILPSVTQQDNEHVSIDFE